MWTTMDLELSKVVDQNLGDSKLILIKYNKKLTFVRRII